MSVGERPPVIPTSGKWQQMVPLLQTHDSSETGVTNATPALQHGQIDALQTQPFKAYMISNSNTLW
jgi:hypothetical protein